MPKRELTKIEQWKINWIERNYEISIYSHTLDEFLEIAILFEENGKKANQGDPRYIEPEFWFQKASDYTFLAEMRQYI